MTGRIDGEGTGGGGVAGGDQGSQELESRISPTLLRSPRALDEICRRWRDVEMLALDTEFVRTRTFFAHLGLIQVFDGTEIVLIDTVALPDLEPFGRLLDEMEGVAILHSCSEDLGIFLHRFGVLPRRLFDTQVAASLAGHGYSVGYQALVQKLLGLVVPKGETRSDWLARPLSPAQLRYAADDVHYLPEIWQILSDEVRSLGREDWVNEEFAKLLDAERYRVEEDEAYMRIKGAGSLDRRGLAVLRSLAAWREKEAKRRDLARNFVVRETSLLEVAKRHPRKEADLRKIPDLRPDQGRRYGRQLLSIVAEASDEGLPPDAGVKPRGRRVRDLRERVRKLQELVSGIANELGIPAETLAQRRLLEELTLTVVADKETDLPPELCGWRRAVIGEPLLRALGVSAQDLQSVSV